MSRVLQFDNTIVLMLISLSRKRDNHKHRDIDNETLNRSYHRVQSDSYIF
ncbi:hypothetical protein [Nonlabens spongiae]|nr:hypothetical protein [Nonlabens spongiae]